MVAASLIRPETWPFLAGYLILLRRRGEIPAAVPALIGVAVAVAWFGPDLLGSGSALTGTEAIGWPVPDGFPELLRARAVDAVRQARDGLTDIEARFARADCTPCPSRSQCTRSKQEPRIIGLLPREQHEALQAARRDNDAHGTLLAADEWDEVTRLARAHGVNLDEVTGDEGDDVIYPGPGADTIYGEEGANTIIATNDGVRDDIFCNMIKVATPPGTIIYLGEVDPLDALRNCKVVVQ